MRFSMWRHNIKAKSKCWIAFALLGLLALVSIEMVHPWRATQLSLESVNLLGFANVTEDPDQSAMVSVSNSLPRAIECVVFATGPAPIRPQTDDFIRPMPRPLLRTRGMIPFDMDFTLLEPGQSRTFYLAACPTNALDVAVQYRLQDTFSEELLERAKKTINENQSWFHLSARPRPVEHLSVRFTSKNALNKTTP